MNLAIFEIIDLIKEELIQFLHLLIDWIWDILELIFTSMVLGVKMKKDIVLAVGILMIIIGIFIILHGIIKYVIM